MTSALALRSPWLAAVLRVQAFVLLALFGIAPVLPALHYSSVEHEVCADHGEVRHVAHHAEQGGDRHGTDRRGAEAEPAGGLPGKHVTALPGALSDDHHDHCAVTAAGVLPATLSAGWASSFEQPAPSAADVVTLRSAQSHVSIALLAYAPKLAPPAFG